MYKVKNLLRTLSSSLSEFIIYVYETSFHSWVIKENCYGGNNPVKLVTDENISDFGLPPSWMNTVIAAPIEKRTEGRTPGIGIEIPINMDVSNIDMIYYSFELNLANPNGEDLHHNIKFMKDQIHL